MTTARFLTLLELLNQGLTLIAKGVQKLIREIKEEIALQQD